MDAPNSKLEVAVDFKSRANEDYIYGRESCNDEEESGVIHCYSSTLPCKHVSKDSKLGSPHWYEG